MEALETTSRKNELLLAKEQQSLLSKKFISYLILRMLGVTILFFSVIIKCFFLEKFTVRYDKHLLWLLLTILGLVIWAIGTMKLKYIKKSVIENNGKISKLKIETTS